MLGAILGDMIGAPYEFDMSPKVKEFPLFSRYSAFTDDTVMTIAVAEALMDSLGKTDEEIRKALVSSMLKWGKRYPDAGYGGMFYQWLHEKNPKPYGSFGNGSAMRVSSAGWLSDTIGETRRIARLTAEVTHNHPEGIKGAEATASAIFLARSGWSKEKIRDYITEEFGYDLSRTCDEIRPGYRHIETCQATVPEAITAFLEGEDFEDVIRTAVSLGGDCDTLTCIAGGMAEAFYGIPREIEEEGRKRLPADMLSVLDRFRAGMDAAEKDPFLRGNERIEEAIRACRVKESGETVSAVLEAIRERMHEDGHFMVPAVISMDRKHISFRTVEDREGKSWMVAFTSPAEQKKGTQTHIVSDFIDSLLRNVLKMESGCQGLVINPWGQSFKLTRERIEKIFEADGGVEYIVPDETPTPELLRGGAFLKRAVGICNRNRTEMNLIKLLMILRESMVWVPCSATVSDADSETVLNMLKEANGDAKSIVGKTITFHDHVRMKPDILQKGDKYYFPVFSSEEEMGEYGREVSKMEMSFPEAVQAARGSGKNVEDIVINAFSEPFEVPLRILDLLEDMKSAGDARRETEDRK